jgi:hypothetical protein
MFAHVLKPRTPAVKGITSWSAARMGAEGRLRPGELFAGRVPLEQPVHGFLLVHEVLRRALRPGVPKESMGDDPVHWSGTQDGECSHGGGLTVDADCLPADGADSGDLKQHHGRFASGEGQEIRPGDGSVLGCHSSAGLQGDPDDPFADEVYGNVGRRGVLD